MHRDEESNRDRLIVEHYWMARAIARVVGSGLGRAEREDLVQVGALALVGQAGRFNRSRGVTFSAFARRRIRGAMLDALRARRDAAEQVLEPEDPGPGPERLATARERERALWRAIKQLPDRQQEVLRLRYFRERTQREAGERLGISQQGARDLEQRAIRRLRRLVERPPEEFPARG